MPKDVLIDESNMNIGANPCDQDELCVVNVPQLHSILKTIWPIALKDISQIYRESYDVMYPLSQWKNPAPSGINFQSFLVAAERRGWFSKYGVNINMMTA